LIIWRRNRFNIPDPSSHQWPSQCLLRPLSLLASIFAPIDSRRHTLWRETEGTNLGRKRGRGTDFASSCAEVDDLDLVGIEFGSCRAVSLVAMAGAPADQKDDTHAWLVREVVNLFRSFCCCCRRQVERGWGKEKPDDGVEKLTSV
jgi:hypothetical protein